MNNKSKKIIIVIAIILTICVVLGISFKMYGMIKEQKYIESQIEIINHKNQNFENAENRSEKIEILKTQIKELENVKKSEYSDSELVSYYISSIYSMKKYFISDYETRISENTIKNINESTDKELIETSKENLEKLVEEINNENIENDKIDEFIEEINSLVLSYEERLNEIQSMNKKETKKTTNKASQENTADNTNKTTTGNGDTETNVSSNQETYSYPYPDHFIHFIPIDGKTGEFVYGTDFEFWEDPDTGICYYKDGTSFTF